MNTRTLIARSLLFHWRKHLLVILGTVTAGAVLVGALVVGDSVRLSLRAIGLRRLGNTELAMLAPNRTLRATMAEALAASLATEVAPVLRLRATVSRPDGMARKNAVQALGVDGRFWSLSPGGLPPATTDPDGVMLNARLARRLAVREGEAVVVRLDTASLLPREAPLSPHADSTVALRATVARILDDEALGNFSLQANQIAPFNIFLPLPRLQALVGIADRANLLLVGRDNELTGQRAGEALRAHFRLADAGYDLRALKRDGTLELRTNRVFVEPQVEKAAAAADTDAIGVITYLVNELGVGEQATPYSLVCALGPLGGGANGPSIPPLPDGVTDGDVVVNAWLAEDLQARVGDVLSMSYYVFGPLQALEERRVSFSVASVAALEGAAADPELMPAYPGLANTESCRDWRAGYLIDATRIRERDERYWKEHRGTPKAFLTLTTGRRLWENRFGALTAVRFPSHHDPSDLESRILLRLSPAALGYSFEPVRTRVAAASQQGLDFGQLFLGLSSFLVVSALVLTCLLFGLALEQRASEVGVLLALGFTPGAVAR
ncbi:hypothetical protein ACFL59_11480, partial [Planctomycetota bacterium]